MKIGFSLYPKGDMDEIHFIRNGADVEIFITKNGYGPESEMIHSSIKAEELIEIIRLLGLNSTVVCSK